MQKNKKQSANSTAAPTPQKPRKVATPQSGSLKEANLTQNIPSATAVPTNTEQEPRKKTSKLKRFSNWGRTWSGLFGIVIAAAALCGTVYQAILSRETAQISREAAQLSVRPKIRYAVNVDLIGKKNGLYIYNLGIGPAIISKMTIEVGGKNYDLLQPSGQGAALDVMGVRSECFTIPTSLEAGTTLKAGEEGALMAVTADPTCAGMVVRAFNRIPTKIHTEYSSLLIRPQQT